MADRCTARRSSQWSVESRVRFADRAVSAIVRCDEHADAISVLRSRSANTGRRVSASTDIYDGSKSVV